MACTTTAVVDLGGTVGEAGEQSKPTEWMPTLQVLLGAEGWEGKTTVTFLAPPHWEFLTVVPWVEQLARCLQVEPSGMA